MTFIFRNRIIFWDISNGIEDKKSGTEGVLEKLFSKKLAHSISIYFMHVQYIFFLKTSTHKTHQFTPFQIINFSFLKIPSCVTSLTIDRFGFVIFFHVEYI